jgi:hypothetical protein
MTWSLYNRTTEASKTFLENVNPVLRCLKFMQNGEYIKNRGFDVRMLAWHCLPSTTKAELDCFFKNTLVPSIMNIEETTLYKDPVLATDWYHKVKTWSELMNDEDMTFVLNSYASAKRMSPATFVKGSKARIYSFWTPGNLPISKILEWQLPTDDMDVEDKKRFLKYEKEVHGNEFDYSDEDETHDQSPVDLEASIQDEAAHAEGSTQVDCDSD